MNMLSATTNPKATVGEDGAALLFIDGKWCSAASSQTFVDQNPTTRERYATVADGGVPDMEAAIAAAKAAQPAWEVSPPAARAEVLFKAVEVLRTSQDRIVKILVEETGSSLGKAMFECSLVVMALREAAGLATRATGEILPSNIPGKVNTIRRTAAGVVGVISPWNFPLYLSLRGFVYALALGNTAVLKPSEDSPISGGALLAELFEAAGLPAGVLNVVPCSRDNVKAVAAALINDPRVARISFTGSTAVGREVALAAAAQFKRVILELGGKNPVVILDDADVDYAVNVAFFSAFLHQGQICMASDKIIVARNLYDSFLEKFVAKVAQFEPLDPSNPISVIGPIINDRQLDRIESLVKSACAAGATIQVGGEKAGPYYRPTVLTGVTRDMDIYRDEVFGPVAFVLAADTEEEAISLANDTIYGLSASLITSDAIRGQELASRVEAGMVHVNDACVQDEPHCPFGGMKASGWVGKWGASGAIEAFTEQRWVSVQAAPRAFPF